MNTIDILTNVTWGITQLFQNEKILIVLRTFLFTLAFASLNGQDLVRAPTAVPRVTGSSVDDWYRPPPSGRSTQFLILPETAGRLIVPVPPIKREKAISMLSNERIVELTPDDCRTLAVPFAGDALIDDAIQKELEEAERAARYLKRHPLDGSEFDNTYYSVLNGIAEGNIKIAHWKKLKGRIRPYLVRAVAANDFHEEFYASFWKGALTVTHRCEIKHSADDPLHTRAALGDIEPPNIVKWPVVVYLEALPTQVYTTIHVLKLGR